MSAIYRADSIKSRGRFMFLSAIILGMAALIFLRDARAAYRFSSSGSAGTTPAVFSILPKLKKLFTPPSPPHVPPAPAPAPEVIKVVSEESQVIEVVKQSSDAVVSIIASADVPKVVQCQQQLPQIEGLPPEFKNFFNVPSLCQSGTEKRRVGAGSGFLVSADGYIVTNRHVVADEKGEYTVVLNDQKHLGQKLKAKVLARDAERDVAVLKVEMNDLPFLNLGDSSKLQVGQTAIAIGYALGEFDNSVSKGVVSGLFRSISASNGASSEQLRGLIQTDAAINPGNSGGPLLDISGNVIGMNTAVADAQSIGFAIPVNEIRTVYQQIRMGGIAKQDKAFLGVRYMAITFEMQAANQLPYDYGMLIGKGDKPADLAITPGAPADKAGIQENDIILEADGKQLNERYLLSDVVLAHKPGDTVTFKVYHKGEIKMMPIVLGKKS